MPHILNTLEGNFLKGIFAAALLCSAFIDHVDHKGVDEEHKAGTIETYNNPNKLVSIITHSTELGETFENFSLIKEQKFTHKIKGFEKIKTEEGRYAQVDFEYYIEENANWLTLRDRVSERTKSDTIYINAITLEHP